MPRTASLRTVPTPATPSAALVALALASALVACAETAPEADSPAEDEAPIGVVEGWACADVDACFGLTLGRTRMYERRVGSKASAEIRTLADHRPLIGEDGERAGTAYVEEDGATPFVRRGDELAMDMRGVTLPALRLPVRAGAMFEVDDGDGNVVTMTVKATDASAETAGGTFAPCVVHEARFANPEEPAGRGLRIETTLCEGIGEVSRVIEVPAVPLPVRFTLLGVDDSALAPDA